MKSKIIIKITSLVLGAVLFSTCETAMEKSQDAYDASMVVPLIIGTTGPSLALTTKTYSFGVSYFRAGSTWAWSVTDATLQSVSEDTRTITVLFNTLPASGKAQIKVVETTAGGATSPEKVIEVNVAPFCPLVGGLGDMVGTWSGEDAYYPSIITTALEGADLKATGMGVGLIEDWWAEEVVEPGTVTIEIKDDGTLNIPRQFAFTTWYNSDSTYYDYEILGNGMWDNCGETPTLKIKYDIYYAGAAKGLAATYASSLNNIPYLTADLTLDGTKSQKLFEFKFKPSPIRK